VHVLYVLCSYAVIVILYVLLYCHVWRTKDTHSTQQASYKGRLSVRPSVCHVGGQQRWRPAGLLLRSGAGSRYRSIAAAVVRHAGRVNSGPTVRRSNILGLICSGFMVQLVLRIERR